MHKYTLFIYNYTLYSYICQSSYYCFINGDNDIFGCSVKVIKPAAIAYYAGSRFLLKKNYLSFIATIETASLDGTLGRTNVYSFSVLP